MISTLALKKADYEREVADFAGWDTVAMAAKIKMDVASGLRRWYYCGHSWTFLKPFAQITLPSGATTVTLPDDFGGVDGGTQASLTSTGLLFLRWMPFTGPGRVLQAISEMSNATGMPRLMSIRPVKSIPAGQMQRSELYFFPTTDQAYTLMFPYFVTPNYLFDPEQPYAYGGVEHHEAILESCLAVTEARRDNVLSIHANEFQRLLKMSIEIDRRQNPTNLGQNWDRSDNAPWEERFNGHGWSNDGGGVTVNGTLYT